MKPEEFDRSWIKRLLLLIFWICCAAAGILLLNAVYLLSSDTGGYRSEETALICAFFGVTGPAALWAAYRAARWVAWGRITPPEAPESSPRIAPPVSSPAARPLISGGEPQRQTTAAEANQ